MSSYIRSGMTFAALSVAVCSGLLQSQDSNTPKLDPSRCLKLVKWPGIAQETPAVCVVRSGWYFCMLPEEMKEVKVSAPQLKSGDVLFETKILQIDSVNRVCLIERMSDANPSGEDMPVTISSSRKAQAGTALTSMCPGNSCRTRIAGKDQIYQGKELPGPMLRVRVEDDSICQPGTPLIDSRGELVALLTDRKMQGKNEAHAIPAAVLLKMLTDYETFQKTGPVWIGAVFQSGATTLEVLEIRKGSPASKGGIKVGDVVLSVADTTVNDFPSLVEVFQSLPAGKETKFKVLRGLDEKELTVVPEFVKGLE